ncbi:L-alanyl-D-glutamate peptidase [Bacillus phage Hoody T]|uniref:Portal protein n=1 Tax=Bacillus phage Hoody T TaxID=1486660 RepID=A0A024B183_9CAUD|nr:L-alanyl-D-glutamate peptidase [Bacillus phage Hoody T]AHZ10399.1 portal protein [Bacillus phage Hoody T]
MKTLRTLAATLVVGAGVLLAGGHDAKAEEVSVVDYLYQKGENHSFDSRAQLAADYGIQNYVGSEQQNINLLTLLKGDMGEVSPRAEQAARDNVQAANKQPQPKVQAVPKQEVQKAKPQGKTITVVATAYTADPAENGGTYGGVVKTATGFNLTANPSAKVIAVDPRVIPLGSKVYVEGYGEAMALDTGGAIKGNRIDVLMPNNKVSNDWGRKTVNVTILN